MIRMPYQKQLKVPVTFPDQLSKSRDYNCVVEYLLYSVFNYFYTESVESRNVHNPHRCSADLLPMLADYYRYSYTDVENIDLERDIISTIPELVHNKGCSIGINNAIELSKVDKASSITIPWMYDKDTNTITVILIEGVKTYKLRELLKLVVPIGTKVLLKPGYFVNPVEEIKFQSWAKINKGNVGENTSTVQSNALEEQWNGKDKYSEYVDKQWNLGNPENKPEDYVTRIGNTEVAKNKNN